MAGLFFAAIAGLIGGSGVYVHAKGKGKSVLSCLVDPVMDAALKSFNEKNAYADIVTGESKSGVNKLVGDMMHEIGVILSNVQVPAVSDVRFFDKGNIYFDYTLAKNVKDSLPEILKQLGAISTAGLFAEYRGKTSDLIKILSSELEKYCECFSVFTVDKKFKIIPVSVNYDKVLQAKKQMIASLKNMEKSIDDYKPDKFTSKSMIKSFIIPEKELQELDYDNLVKRYTLNYVNAAIKCLKEYTEAYNAENQGKQGYQNMDWWNFGGAINDIGSNGDYSGDDQKRIVAARQAVLGIKGDNLSDEAKLKTRGGIACRRLAEKDLAPLKDLRGMVEAVGHEIPRVLFGDYALKLKECVKYTLQNISSIIKIGAKKTNLKADEPSLFGVDLKTLLGKEYEGDIQRWSKRERVIHKAVDTKLLKNADLCYLKAKKEYENITKQRNKVFGKDSSKWESNLSKLIVILESRSTDTGKKHFNIATKFEELVNDHAEALKNQSNKDFVAVCLRKSEKFLRACERWNEDFKEYKALEKQKNDEHKLAAKHFIDEAKEHYKELMGECKVTRKQSKEEKAKNKRIQSNVEKAYKELPSSVSKFIKNFETNCGAVNNFRVKEIKDFILDNEKKVNQN